MAALRGVGATFLALLAAGALGACGTLKPVTALDDQPKSGAGTAETVSLLTAVGIGQTLDHDRVTFRFQGAGTPGFRVAYVDPPIIEDGSGHPVEIAGAHYVEIRMEPASGADLGGPELVITYPGPHRLPGPAGGVLREAARTGDFEAVLTWVVGLDSRTAFQVSRDSDPGRIILDFVRP